MAHKIDENNCIGCSACMNLCPVFAISGEKGQPFIINDKRCVDCGVCTRVCPKNAIEDEDGTRPDRLKREFWPKPIIDEELCSACGLCIHWCTAGALDTSMPEFKGDIDANAVLVSPEKCVGCSLCRKHCPLDAIRMVANENS